MERPERRMVVVGALSGQDLAGQWPGEHWQLLDAPSPEAAHDLLSNDPELRVGLWDASLASGEDREKFSVLRGRHRRVQWIAMLRAGAVIDERLAAFVAQDFFDYLTLPLEPERLCRLAGHAYGMSLITERAQGFAMPASDEPQMVGTSELMRRLYRDIRKVAASDAPVFVFGESGTGKELAACAIHERSRRAKGPFVAVDCGSMPATLIQSELFGYEKGAFTGAAQRKGGRIEAADGGTLFLDEIGDLPLDLQANLLRFLQDSTVQRLGSTRPITVDARVIAATHVDLEEAVRNRRFREDLYYRLNVLRVETPPLREREGDIEVLARFFLEQFIRDSRKRISGYTAPALDAMRRYGWPGNVRELINRVRRAVVMCDGRWIGPRDLDLDHPTAQNGSPTLLLEAAREAAERQAVRDAIRLCSNNYSAAARTLGVSRVTLYRLLEKHRVSTGVPPS